MVIFHGYVKEPDDYPLVNWNKKLLKMTMELVSFPSYKMVIVHCYVSLPEGSSFVRG